MAKKKKGKLNDARGYGQGAGGATPRSSAPAVHKTPSTASAQATHDGMQSLLQQMKEETGSSSQSTTATATATASYVSNSTRVSVASDRFASRLQKIVEQLDQLQFHSQHVENVVESLGYSITLESALDWLCLHVPTMELPPLLTDGHLRNAFTTSTATNDSSLTVLKITKVTRDESDDGEISNFPKSKTPSYIEEDSKEDTQAESRRQAEEDEEKAKQKAWLLQQYQYEDEDGAESVDDRVAVETPRTLQTTQSETVNETEEPLPEFEELSPEMQYLAEQMAEVAALEADVNNEANNYMRTKQEIKHLRIELKQKKQMVEGLRRKMEREKAKRRKEREARMLEETDKGDDEDEDEEEEPGSFLDVFGNSGDDAQAEITPKDSCDNTNAFETPASDPTPPTPSIDAVVPNSWTGNTPQKALEEYCRKQKLPRPKFTKLPYNQGYSLTLTQNTSKKKRETAKTTANNSDFVQRSSLPDYLAIQALYKMEPTLPFYHMFPPSFRDLWLSWLREKEEIKSQQARALDSEKQYRLNQLLALISKNESNATDETNAADPADESFDSRCTDAQEWGAHAIPSTSVTESGLSKKDLQLQKAFQTRQSTPGYQDMLKVRSTLPMTSFREEILDTVEKNPVTILSAQTGAGKTTQCPQFLLEQALTRGKGGSTQILVTQPRRVAAMSVAERVSEEMCEPRIGGLVGYQIRMEAKRSADTRLLFCTTGIVLRRLQDDRNLSGVTHVLVDEVHERQQQTDVLLVALRELLQSTRPDLKIILMSATLDSKLFCSFFGNAPLIEVPGRTFPVASFHLEDCLDATNHIIEEGSPYSSHRISSGEQATLLVTKKGGDKRREVVDLESQTDVSGVSDFYAGYKMSTRRSMDRVNEEVINYDLLEDVLTLILCRHEQNSTLLPPSGSDMSKGSVLIFLPGLGEIRSVTERLEGNRQFLGKFDIVPLHSSLSSNDQRRAFKLGTRKIILATNIAETSITVPDVICVIDTGRVREVRRNKRTSTSILVTDWCSKASAKQRAGRAGRVQPGLCLKLYSRHTDDVVMKPASEPELRRVPLEEVCMSILASGFAKSSMEFLSKAPQPPEEASVKAAVEILEEVGAIEVNEHNISSSKRVERLTPLGHHLAKLPVDVRLGKMLIFGALFRCLDKALTVAATLSSSKSPFSTFVKDASIAKAKHQAFADPDSDFGTYCNVWESYEEAKAISSNSARKFCQSNFLSMQAMREIGDARQQFFDLLCGIGFVDRTSIEMSKGDDRRAALRSMRKSIYNENGNHTSLLNAVICAGIYPNVAHLKPGNSPSEYTMNHKKNERLFFHNSSVNAKRKVYSEGYICFYEKFGTVNRVSVAATCFVHPYSLLLFGGMAQVKHTERRVIIDGWLEIKMAAQTSVIMKELRHQVDALLSKMIEKVVSREIKAMSSNMVNGIASILPT